MWAFAVDFFGSSNKLGHKSVGDHDKFILFVAVLFKIWDVLHQSSAEVDVKELRAPTGSKHRNAFWKIIH